MRIDKYLVEKGLVKSRVRAAEFIKKGKIVCNGSVVQKASFDVPEDAVVTVDDDEVTYVGRGALKLSYALDNFGVSPCGCVCVDVGASTGGFTDVLLHRGALKVYAVDTGHGQLDASLKNDPRVVDMEGFNAKTLSPDHLGDTVDLAVCDVSFISQTLLHPAIRSVLKDKGFFIGLVKPQFELTKKDLSKHGIVKDVSARFKASERAFLSLINNGFSVKGFCVSPITGGDGNVEYLICASASDDASKIGLSDIERIVYENWDSSTKRQ